jgi:hypothetical protein
MAQTALDAIRACQTMRVMAGLRTVQPDAADALETELQSITSAIDGRRG